jgi:apolipoprotein N-acyltransferase
VQNFWAKSRLNGRYPLAILAGFLWTAAFPQFDVAGFAWIAPGLMIASALGVSAGESFRLGYVAGFAHYLSMLYWLLLIPYRWHGIPFGPALGWVALGAFLALFPATWVWLARPALSSSNARRSSDSSKHSLYPEPRAMLPRNWVLRTLWALSGAAAWVGLEMFLARIFGGFAWDLLGVSQYRITPLIQISAVTGVYGLSFLAVWVSLSLVAAGVMIIQRPTSRSVWIAEVFLPVLLVAILFNVGLRQLRSPEPAGRILKTTLVQPSIPQALIWDANNDIARFDELLRLSEQALTNQTDLLIWPEAAVPKMLRYDKDMFEGITGLAKRHHVWMIVGSDDAEPRGKGKSADDTDFFNSSFLISPEGELVQRYLKRNLVIFGEYVPLHDWLPFLKYFTPIEGGFTAGKTITPFELTTLHTKTQVLICYEDTFPHLARQELATDIDFLVNITNDGWFGEGAAQWQQAATGLFRAVENHLPLIRCSNNGVTCWIDARGVVRDVFTDANGSIYGKGFLTAQISLPPEGTKHALTFYTRHGDWFGWSCSAIGAAILVQRLLKARSARPGQPR